MPLHQGESGANIEETYGREFNAHKKPDFGVLGTYQVKPGAAVDRTSLQCIVADLKSQNGALESAVCRMNAILSRAVAGGIPEGSGASMDAAPPAGTVGEIHDLLHFTEASTRLLHQQLDILETIL